MWKLKKFLWVKEEIKRETKKYFEPNEMKTQHIKIWDAAKAVFRQKFITLKRGLTFRKKGLISISSISTLRNLIKMSKLNTKYQRKEIMSGNQLNRKQKT